MPGIYGAPRVIGAYLERPRITALLDGDEPVTILRAGAGAGKTVAAAQWAAASGAEGLWVTVDEGCRTRAAFWTRVVERLVDAGSLSRGNPLTALLAAEADGEVRLDAAGAADADPAGTAEADDSAAPDPAGADPTGADPASLHALLQRGLLRLRRPLHLVVDDAHRLAELEVFRDVAELASSTPLRVVLLTRVRCPLETGALQLQYRPRALGRHELAFDRAETARLLGRPVDDARVEIVAEAARGNGALTQAAVRAVERTGHGTVDAIGEAVQAAIVEIVRDAILVGRLSDIELDHATRLSLPDRLTGELASRLIGADAADGVLAACEAAGLGGWADAGERVFVFGQPMAQVLRAEASTRPADELAGLHLVVARYERERARPVHALRHALAGDDLGLATELAIEHWYTLLFEQGPQVEELLSAVPFERLRAHPLLAMVLALYYYARPTLRARGAELYRAASLGPRERRSRDRVEQIMLSVLDGIARFALGDGDGALAAFFHTDALLQALDGDEMHRLGANLPAIMTQLSIGYCYTGRPDRGTELLQRVWAMPASVNERERLHALALLAGFSAARGELVAARAYLEQAHAERWRREWIHGYVGVQLHVAEALVAVERHDYAAAQAGIDAIPVTLRDGQHSHLVHDLQAVVDMGAGRLAQGAAAHARMLEADAFRMLTAQGQAWALSYQALLMGADGQLAEARRVVARADSRFPVANLVAAALELALGAPARALVRLAQISIADEPSVRVRVEARLLHAAAALRGGRGREAGVQLGEALALMERHGMRNPYFALGLGVLDELLRWAQDPASGFAEQLARVMPSPPPVTPVVQRARSVELTERERIVLTELATERSRAQIAAALFVSENTIKTQVRGLYRKLGVWSREEAVRVARLRGLLPGRDGEPV